MYLKGITDRNVGLANITLREILEFLLQNYRNITQYDIEDNDKKLKEKWDANTPIEMLFNQIEDAQDFAAAPDNHTPTTIDKEHANSPCLDMSNSPSTNFNTGSKVPINPLTPLILIKQQKNRVYP